MDDLTVSKSVKNGDISSDVSDEYVKQLIQKKYDCLTDASHPLLQEFYAKSKSVSAHIFVSNRLKYVWIHYPTPQYFQPTRVLAHPTAVASAKDTRYVNLGWRLRKRKEAWAKSHFYVAKHILQKIFKKRF